MAPAPESSLIRLHEELSIPEPLGIGSPVYVLQCLYAQDDVIATPARIIGHRIDNHITTSGKVQFFFLSYLIEQDDGAQIIQPHAFEDKDNKQFRTGMIGSYLFTDASDAKNCARELRARMIKNIATLDKMLSGDDLPSGLKHSPRDDVSGPRPPGLRFKAPNPGSGR